MMYPVNEIILRMKKEINQTHFIMHKKKTTCNNVHFLQYE